MTTDFERRREARGQLTTARASVPTQFEVRAKSGGKVEIEGYASIYETPYTMWDFYGEYDEVVRLGAGKKTLSENPQVQLLLNHAGLAMSYTRAGTLTLADDENGLHVLSEVNTKRSDVRDMVAAIEDGAVDEMSFAFRVERQQWSPDYDQRDIIEFNLNRGDVSVVNFGANPATAVGLARSLKVDDLSDDEARALLGRLQTRFGVADLRPADRQVQPAGLSLAEAELSLLG